MAVVIVGLTGREVGRPPADLVVPALVAVADEADANASAEAVAVLDPVSPAMEVEGQAPEATLEREAVVVARGHPLKLRLVDRDTGRGAALMFVGITDEEGTTFHGYTDEAGEVEALMEYGRVTVGVLPFVDWAEGMDYDGLGSRYVAAQHWVGFGPRDHGPVEVKVKSQGLVPIDVGTEVPASARVDFWIAHRMTLDVHRCAGSALTELDPGNPLQGASEKTTHLLELPGAKWTCEEFAAVDVWLHGKMRQPDSRRMLHAVAHVEGELWAGSVGAAALPELGGEPLRLRMRKASLGTLPSSELSMQYRDEVMAGKERAAAGGR